MGCTSSFGICTFGFETIPLRYEIKSPKFKGMKKPDLALLKAVICILILSISGSEAHTQKATVTSELNGQAMDPFIGKFKLNFNGTEIILEIANVRGSEYLVYANRLGPDKATKNGNFLSGISEGIHFSIKQLDKDLVFMVNNQEYSLIRVGKTLNVESEKKDSDPFVGIYDVSHQGQIKEKWTIQKLDESKYNLISPSGTSQATRNGLVLNGFDEANQISYVLEKKGDLIVMNIAGIQFELINRKEISKQNVIGQNGISDPRLIGSWSGSTSYNSSGGVGSASIAFQKTYMFNSDGTFQSKSSNAGGGSDWSAHSDGGIESGMYHILSKDHDGGIISIHGNQLKYVFYSEGYKMKLGNMHYSRH